MMNKWQQDLTTSLSFLTRIPMPRTPHPPSGEENARALRCYPLVGAILALILTLFITPLMGLGVPVVFIAILTITLLALITGAMHEDALADLADGCGALHSREKMLAIMRDSHIGAFGVIALIIVLALRIAALYYILQGGSIMIMGAMLVVALSCSRTSMVMLMVQLKPARSDGLSSNFQTMPAKYIWQMLAISMVILLVSHGFGLGLLELLVALGSCAFVYFLMLLFMRKKLGGHTGDTIGATGILCETTLLLIFASL